MRQQWRLRDRRVGRCADVDRRPRGVGRDGARFPPPPRARSQRAPRWSGSSAAAPAPTVHECQQEYETFPASMKADVDAYAACLRTMVSGVADALVDAASDAGCPTSSDSLNRWYQHGGCEGMAAQVNMDLGAFDSCSGTAVSCTTPSARATARAAPSNAADGRRLHRQQRHPHALRPGRGRLRDGPRLHQRRLPGVRRRWPVELLLFAGAAGLPRCRRLSPRRA